MITDQQLDQAAERIRSGGLVAIPTETVYGLAANALDARAVARIYEAKGRPATSPLIVHVADIEMAKQLVTEWPAAAGRLAERYWPGPLTLVLPKHPSIPGIVTSGLPTVGIRLPAHPVALEVIRRAGTPIAAPSANRFTEISPTTAGHVRHSLGDRVDLILDAGPCEVGIESVVVSLAGGFTLLRPGVIPISELEQTAGMAASLAGAVEGAHPSPGMHARHYSPRTPVHLVKDTLPQGRGVYLWRDVLLPAEAAIHMPAGPQEYARKIYQALHEADAAGLDWIAIEDIPAAAEWDGVRDRLRRAATR